MIRATFLLSIAALTPAALGRAAPVAVEAEHVFGQVAQLEQKEDRFTLKVGEKLRTFTVDRSTLYYLDEKIATRELVLVVGKTVKVTYTDDLAKRVDGTTVDPRGGLRPVFDENFAP
jgi:hypothetical protein